MAIYYCPQCNKKYFFDGETSEFEKEFRCEMCGYPSTKSTRSSTQNTLHHNTTMSDREIQIAQLKSLHNIESMIKFFVVLTVINIIATIIIGAVSIASLF